MAKQHHHDGFSISAVHYVCTMSLHSKMLSVQHRAGRPEGPGSDICIKHPQFIRYIPKARIQLPTKHVDIVLQSTRVAFKNENFPFEALHHLKVSKKQNVGHQFPCITGACFLQRIQPINALSLEGSPQRTSSPAALLRF